MPAIRSIPHPDTAAILEWQRTTDAQQVYAIHTNVLARTPPGMVRADSLAHFENHVEMDGLMVACHLPDGAMVAYGVLAVASPIVAHVAHLLRASAQRLAVLDGAAALPEWRGHCLHQAAIARRIDHAAALGRSMVAATVAPSNLRALRSMLRAGLTIRAYANMYGGLARLVVTHDSMEATRAWRHESSVAVADLASHQIMLAAGYTGYACNQSDAGEWMIAYGHAG